MGSLWPATGLGVRTNLLLHSLPSLPLAYCAKRDQFCDLLLAGARGFLLPVVDRLGAHAHELSKIGCRKAQSFALCAQPFRDKADTL